MGIIIKLVDEIDKRCRFVSDDPETVPIMARYPDHLQVVSCGYDLIQFPCFIIIGADLQRSANGQKMIHLPTLMPMPGSHHSRITHGHIGLSDII